MTDRLCVSLSGMRFHARVGILAHERELPQPLEIDVDAWPARPAEVLDYRALYDVAASVVASTELLYLEEVASRVADAALALGRVSRVRVAVRKPHVALPGPLAHAGVVLERDARDARDAADASRRDG